MCSIAVDLLFFQAEDGIRDLVRSRGLGDVYKRQIRYAAPAAYRVPAPPHPPQSATDAPPRRFPGTPQKMESVSYTHLTLPTSDLV